MTTSLLHSSFQLSFRVENADTSEKKLKQMILEFLNGNSDQNSDKLINISITKLNGTENFFSKEVPSLFFQYSTHFINENEK